MHKEMKILIITQVVDIQHPILGFFHRWIEEFAQHCEHVHVVALEVGEHTLPHNVTVHSLGKEVGEGRLNYLQHFYSYVWQLRHEYDVVFVHMNQLYVLLGGVLWRLMNKKVGLWYMHGSTPLSLRVAEMLVHRVLTGSPESFRLKSKKVKVTGHGIDTEHFKPLDNVEKDIDLITVGRLTKSKNLIQMVDVLSEVRQNHSVSLTIVGAAVTPSEQAYEARLREYVTTNNLAGCVHFEGRVSQAELPALLNRAKVFITTAQNGSLDKAVLEAMACGVPVVSIAPGTMSLGLRNQVKDSAAMITTINSILEGQNIFDEDAVAQVQNEHSLNRLIVLLTQQLNTK